MTAQRFAGTENALSPMLHREREIVKIMRDLMRSQLHKVRTLVLWSPQHRWDTPESLGYAKGPLLGITLQCAKLL